MTYMQLAVITKSAVYASTSVRPRWWRHCRTINEYSASIILPEYDACNYADDVGVLSDGEMQLFFLGGPSTACACNPTWRRLIFLLKETRATGGGKCAPCMPVCFRVPVTPEDSYSMVPGSWARLHKLCEQNITENLCRRHRCMA